MSIVQSKRGTGRTTRMLEKAIDHARKGSRVCIVASNKRNEQQIESQLRLMAKNQGCPWIMDANVRIFSVYAPPVVEGPYGVFKVRGHDEVVLVDHHVYEEKYGDVLDGWWGAQ